MNRIASCAALLLAASTLFAQQEPGNLKILTGLSKLQLQREMNVMPWSRRPLRLLPRRTIQGERRQVGLRQRRQSEEGGRAQDAGDDVRPEQELVQRTAGAPSTPATTATPSPPRSCRCRNRSRSSRPSSRTGARIPRRRTSSRSTSRPSAAREPPLLGKPET